MSAAKSTAPAAKLYVGETTVTKAITAAGGFTPILPATKSGSSAPTASASRWITTDALQDPSKDPQVYPGDQINVPRRTLLMIQLNILSGKKAGAQSVARHFPFRIGRAAQNDLQLEDDGVWDQHLVLEFQNHEGFNLTTSANALATVNGETVQR